MSTPRGYKQYSRTSSGGVIYTNPAAPPDKRWLIEHKDFGNKYFADHDDILKWTVEETVKHFERLNQPSAPRGSDDTDGQHRP
jgi:hypothetical protein